MQSFGELGIAAYCPRQLYYHRRDDATPDRATASRALAIRYDDLVAGTVPADRLAASKTTVQRRLQRVRERFPEAWPELCDPADTDVALTGRDARGEVAKLLSTAPPAPTLVSPGTPPQSGVWEPQGVRAVAAALALAWERDRRIERAFVEYPAHGIVRRVAVTPRRRATYRRALRTARTVDGPPPRINAPAKCEACAYQAECGPRHRSLSSLLF